MGNKYLDQNGLRTLIQSVALKINQKASGTVLAITSQNVNNIVVNSTDPLNPTIDLSSDIISKINTLWEIELNGIGKEPTPSPVLGYIFEKLSNLVSNSDRKSVV